MHSAPMSSSVLPATSMPNSTTTPARPTKRPTRRRPVTRSSWSSRIASSAMISGSDATMIAASDEATCCSPNAMSGNGMQISSSANAASGTSLERSPVSAPDHHASGMSSTAAIATRIQLRNAGDTPSSTAILMKRYGMPHTTETAAKVTQPLRVTQGKLVGTPPRKDGGDGLQQDREIQERRPALEVEEVEAHEVVEVEVRAAGDLPEPRDAGQHEVALLVPA